MQNVFIQIYENKNKKKSFFFSWAQTKTQFLVLKEKNSFLVGILINYVQISSIGTHKSNEQKPVHSGKSWFNVTEFKGIIFMITRHIIIYNRCLCQSISFCSHTQNTAHENILEHTIARLKICTWARSRPCDSECMRHSIHKIPNCILFGQMQGKCSMKTALLFRNIIFPFQHKCVCNELALSVPHCRNAWKYSERINRLIKICQIETRIQPWLVFLWQFCIMPMSMSMLYPDEITILHLKHSATLTASSSADRSSLSSNNAASLQFQF